MSKKKRFILTGGGTGGHVYPNIAIFESLKDKYKDAEFLYIGTNNSAESRIIKNLTYHIEYKTVLSKGLPMKIKSFKTIISLLYIFLGFLKSIFIIKKFKPDLIVGSGGYVSAPALFAGAFLKRKIFVHEQNAIPGRLNLLMGKFATRVGVTFESTKKFFPSEKVLFTGYPLRKSIVDNNEDNEKIKKKYNIPADNKVLFVFGGSVGAKTINRAMVEILPMLLNLKKTSIIMSTGRAYSKEYKAYEDTIKQLDKANIQPSIEGKLIIKEYFDDIDDIYAISDLIVCRAGAGTIKELTLIKKPSILIPKINLPGDHQILNAKELEQIGCAEIIYEDVLETENRREIFISPVPLFNKIKDLLFSKKKLKLMSESLQNIKKINTSQKIITEIEKIISQKTFKKKKLKVFYLNSLFEDKTYEMVFNSTSFGNSFLSDYNLGNFLKNVYFEVKIDSKTNKMLLRCLKGVVLVNDNTVDKWIEIFPDDIITLIDETGNEFKYQLKTYEEEIDISIDNKTTASKIKGSSLGILTSRVGGFLREIITAAFFGAGKIMDIFSVGITLSNLIRRIVAENSMDNIFLPIFSRMLNRMNKKDVWRAAASIINVTLLIAIVSTILGIVFTPQLIKVFFPGLVTKGLLNETVNMTRLMFPYLIFVTISAVMASYLKAFNRFGTAEGSMIFYSIGIVSSIILLNRSIGIYSLAVGVLFGGILQIIFLFPFTAGVLKQKSLEFSYKPHIDFSSAINKRYYSQLWPISIDVLLSKISEIVDLFIASGLSVGTLSFMYYSKTIYRLPFSIISQGMNTVILKEFSEKIALFDKNKAKRLFIDGIKTNVFLLLPISIIMYLFSEEIVSILLERFKFNAADVIFTAQALKAYSIGLVGWGVYSLTTRIFSARIDIKTSMILNAIMIVSNIALCFYLVSTPLGYIGLALASSISFIIFSVIRIIILKHKLNHEGIAVTSEEIYGSVIKSLISGLIMIFILVETKIIFSKFHFSSKLTHNLIVLISSLLIGFAVYLLLSILLKNTEILILKKRKQKRKNSTSINFLSPFAFLNKIQENPEKFAEDYNYKVNVYLCNSNWAIQNVGIKLIGLFKDNSKKEYLMNLIKTNKNNNFMKRNAIISLSQLGIWEDEFKEDIINQLSNTYYEIRIATIYYLVNNMPNNQYSLFRNIMKDKINKIRIEEKLAYIKFISRFGEIEDLKLLRPYFLHSNSLIREEILLLLLNFYNRKILNKEKIKEYIGNILITSNNLRAEFKLKQIIRNIYREIDK